jgi:hypothetical protein
MRKFLLGAAMLAAIAAPGVAAANGYVGVDYANTDNDVDSEDVFGVSGSIVATPNLAFDGSIADDDTATLWDVNGHLFTNNSSYLLGAFIGFGESDSSSTIQGGFEGQYYLSNLTLAAALAYGSDDDTNGHAWGVNGEARYFIGENFRVQGGVGWFNTEISDLDQEDDLLAFSVGAEYQLSAAPVSLAVGYANLQADEADADTNVISASVRYNFGAGSLLDRDRSGGGLAGLAGVTSALGL